MERIAGVVSAVLAQGSARVLALLFLAYGLAGSMVLSIAVPPTQTPDEPMHAMRAAHVADGFIFGAAFDEAGADGRVFRVSGGMVDPALVAVMQPFQALIFHPERRAVAAMWEPRYLWSSERMRQRFVTSMYPPMLYLPQAATVLVGRMAGASVVDTLTVARMVNGACGVALGALAIALAGGAAVWLFALLTLPMALSGMATMGPDALLLGASALSAALLWRMVRGAPARGAFAALLGLLCLVVTTRPAYAGLALLPLAAGAVAMRARLAGAALVLAAAGGWSVVAALTGVPNVGVHHLGTDPVAQMQLLLSEPWRVAQVAAATLEMHWLGYAYSFVGVLGWLDTLLPGEYYRAAGLVLAASWAAMLLGPRVAVGRAVAPWVLAAPVAALAGIFGILYLTWSPVGHAVVNGAQGRYFLPLAMLAGVAMPGLGGGVFAVRLRRVLLAGVALFPAVSLGIAVQAVIARFYLG